MVFRAGIEFSVVKNFVLRTGIATNSTLISLGMGYKTKGLSIDLAFSYHQYLGYSPFITLSYNFGE
jgi:long-subunit fatty acid transport protein